jgi:uracil-DNA glycosylase
MAINCCDAEIVVTIGAEALEAVKLLSRHKFKLKESVGKAHHWNNRILFPLYHPGRQGRANRSREKQLADIQPLKEIISKLKLHSEHS